MRLSHDRRSLRLQSYDYSQPGAYFITICTYEKKNLLGNIVDGEMNLTEAGRTIWDIWESLPKQYPEIQLDAFVVMPNHIHGIIMVLYNAVVGAIHAVSHRRAVGSRGTNGECPYPVLVSNAVGCYYLRLSATLK